MADSKLNIDIIILTLNSLEPCLRECLESVERECQEAALTPRLIVVDGGSTDGTLELVSEFDQLNPLVIDDSNGTRATARQIGIEAVETELFMFLDSDVILNPGYFPPVLRLFENEEVGAVWSVTIAREKTEREYKDALSNFYKRTERDMALQYANLRGLTHDTVIRTKAVEGIQIPRELHVMEDHFIRLYVENNGYKWVNNTKSSCIHNRHERVGKTAYLDAYYGRKLGIYDTKWFVKHMLLFPFKLAYLTLATRNKKLIRIEAVKELNFVKATWDLVQDYVEGKPNKIMNMIEKAKKS